MNNRPIGSIQEYLDKQSGNYSDGPRAHENEEDRFNSARDELFRLLSLSPTFQACILDFRTTYAMFYPVIWRDLGSYSGGACDQMSRRIFLNTRAYDNLGLPNMIQTAAHEYRHAWQQTQKVAKLLFDRLENQIVHMRKIEGDAVAFQLTVAWELRECGHPEVWDSALPLMLSEYPECTRAFTAELDADPRALWTGRAQSAVVLAWQRNRPRSGSYEDGKARAFQYFNQRSRRAKATLRLLSVDDSDIEARLFKMPYVVDEGGGRSGVRDREQYGQISLTDRKRLEAVALARSRLQAKRCNRLARAL